MLAGGFAVTDLEQQQLLTDLQQQLAHNDVSLVTINGSVPDQGCRKLLNKLVAVCHLADVLSG